MSDDLANLVPERDRNEEVEVQEPVPSIEPTPALIITTKRKGGITRSMPLTETHGMTTEANRFRTD